MDGHDIEKFAEDIRALISERLRLRATNLEAALKKAGRRLPRRLRREGGVLLQAERDATHPRLRARIDPRRVARARAALIAHLEELNPKEARKTQGLRLLGDISLKLLIVSGAFLAYLVLAGHV